MNQDLINVSDVMALAVATGLFVSSCVIQQPSGTLGASGAPDGNYTTVSGLGSIQCMDAPNITSDMKVGPLERRNASEIEDEAMRHVLLDDYYPTVITGWRSGWRAIVDGVTYDLMGAEADSQRTQTRLALRLVTT